MNKVILMGRLTRDPEVRYSQGASQTAVAKFSLAVDRRFKREGQPEADFFNCTVFGKQAETVEKYLRKGNKIVVCGSIQNDNYTNKDGQKVYSVQIIVDEFSFAESKNASSGSGDGAYQAGTRPSPSQAAGEDFMSIPNGAEKSLPFD